MVRVDGAMINKTVDDVQHISPFDKVKAQLKQSYFDEVEYINFKSDLELKEAKLLITTDWGAALPNHNKITVGDKEAWIKIQLSTDKQELRKLRVKKEYSKEIYELEKRNYLKKEEEDIKEEL